MLKPPPFLLGAALLFWGWRVDLLWVGALLGALLELPHAVKGRWDLSDSEFNRLWDVCTIIFVGVAFYLRMSEEITAGAYKFFQWMPLIFYLMALGLVFSTRDVVPMKAFSWFLRRKGAERGNHAIAFAWIYVVTCLVAAGASNERDLWFFFGLVAICGWSLWSVRPARLPNWAWSLLFVVIAGTAFHAQGRLPELQNYLEGKATELLAALGRRDFNPYQSHTALGRVGELKQSGRIVLKVFPEAGRFPERLRAAVFSLYEGVTWKMRGRDFDAMAVEPDLTTWTLVTNATHIGRTRIVQRAARAGELLALPHGTTLLSDLIAGNVETNGVGAVRAEDNPGLLNFVAHTSTNTFDVAPRGRDLEFAQERDVLAIIAKELGIDRLSDRDKIMAIERFFEEKFRYTTYQKARALGLRRGGTALAEFLLETRAGHCEHFATATVMLLRYYGIPARYVIGYAVQQDAKEGDGYLVRERDAHAWAMAFLGEKQTSEDIERDGMRGRWIEVDSTPADWAQREKQEFPSYQSLKDYWGRFAYGFLEWRWLGDWSFFRLAAPWLVVPMIGFLAWRIFGRKMSVRKRPVRETQLWPGADSDFYTLERKLAKAGLARHELESAAEWDRRLAANAPTLHDILLGVLHLHTRYRFDPVGITAQERERLRQMVHDCAARL